MSEITGILSTGPSQEAAGLLAQSPVLSGKVVQPGVFEQPAILITLGWVLVILGVFAGLAILGAYLYRLRNTKKAA